MRLYVTCKKSSVIIMIAFILAVFCAFAFSINNTSDVILETEAAREKFLGDLGYENCGEPKETAEIKIPYEFNDVYKEYNKLQLQAGFDLSNYSGQFVQRYTYSIGDNLLINILMKDDKLIGGDICDPSLNGKMLPLAKNDNNE